MITLFKAALAGTAFVALAGTAAAEATFSADFTYTETAPVQVTYTAFERTAKRACRAEMRDIRQLGARMKMEQSCTAQLLAQAVEATRSDVLIAYHDQRTGPQATRRQFAGVSQ